MKAKNSTKKYSKTSLEKIKKRAEEIWKSKRDSLNTALDDWLQAEKEIKAQSGIEHKKSDEYTPQEVRLIRERAEAVRAEKIDSLRTAFDDWIEAEAELKDELTGSVDLNDLFDRWFEKVSKSVRVILETEESPSEEVINEVYARQYVEFMTECLN
jgi:hypothetical protein